MKVYVVSIRLAIIAFALLCAMSADSGFAKPAHQTQQKSTSQDEEQSADGAKDTEADPTVIALRSLKWKYAPQVGNIGYEAAIALSPDVTFLEAADTNRFLEINGNLPCNHLNCYALAAQSLGWFAIFSFDPGGYVKDDEAIDPDALLKILKERNAASLEEKRQRGLPLLYLDGWYIPSL